MSTNDPCVEDLLENMDGLSIDHMMKLNKIVGVNSAEVIDQARNDVQQLNLILEEVKDHYETIQQFHTETEPLMKEIGDELVKLDELYRLRGLVVRLKTVKEVHANLEYLLNHKSSKQFELDTKLIQAVEIFQKLIEIYEEVSKSAPKTNAIVVYLRNVLSHWHDELRKRLEPRFETILKQISWPLVGINALPGSASTIQGSVTFDTFFSALLRTEIRHHFEEQKSNKIRICLPLELMIVPLRKRFIYHFMKNSRTNQLEKPEWYLTQTLNWIKDNSEYLVQNVDPILKLNSDKALASSKIQFSCGLLELVKIKLKTDLNELIFDDRLFSHTYDEVLSFARELETVFGGNKILVKQNCDLFALFTMEPYFNKLISLERKKSMEYIELILESGTAWLPMISPITDEPDEDDLKATEVADNFVILLQSINERTSFIADSEATQAFLQLQLELLDDFRLRLAQLVRMNQTDNDDDKQDNVKKWPFSQRYYGILNTVNYLIKILEEWRLTPVFIEASNLTIENLLDDTISMFKHMLQDMYQRVTRSLINQIRVKIYPYANIKWFCLQMDDDNALINSCAMLHFISSSLTLLKKSLALSIFNIICIAVAKDINKIILEEVILKNNFNDDGATFLRDDVKTKLCSIFTNHIRKPESLFTEIIEATTLLCLQQGTAMMLDEAQYSPEEDSILSDIGVEILEPELAIGISRRRLYL